MAAARKSMPSASSAPQRSACAGDWVDIDGMARLGRVLELDARRKQARVLVGDQEWMLPLRRLRVAAAPPEAEAPRNLVRVVGSSAVLHEVDLHGLRVEDALELADRALDQAVVHNLSQIKLIHGHGTGALRTAIRDLLARHPHVANYRFGGPAEGGLACTIAEIRSARP